MDLLLALAAECRRRRRAGQRSRRRPARRGHPHAGRRLAAADRRRAGLAPGGPHPPPHDRRGPAGGHHARLVVAAGPHGRGRRRAPRGDLHRVQVDRQDDPGPARPAVRVRLRAGARLPRGRRAARQGRHHRGRAHGRGRGAGPGRGRDAPGPAGRPRPPLRTSRDRGAVVADGTAGRGGPGRRPAGRAAGHARRPPGGRGGRVPGGQPPPSGLRTVARPGPAERHRAEGQGLRRRRRGGSHPPHRRRRRPAPEASSVAGLGASAARRLVVLVGKLHLGSLRMRARTLWRRTTRVGGPECGGRGNPRSPSPGGGMGAGDGHPYRRPCPPIPHPARGGHRARTSRIRLLPPPMEGDRPLGGRPRRPLRRQGRLRRQPSPTAAAFPAPTPRRPTTWPARRCPT